jgi:sugar lactone lactonase YvrE
MITNSWLKRIQTLIGTKPSDAERLRSRKRQMRRVRLRLEELEDRLVPTVGTSTVVAALVNGITVATVGYGTITTLVATVSPASGNAAPTAGAVDFHEGSIDLGSVSTETMSGTKAIFTLKTTATQLQVSQANNGVNTMTAAYSPGVGFSGSSTSLAGGLAVTPAPLTITAIANTKAYDGTASAAAIPTVSGLFGNDSIAGLSESYSNANAGTGKTLVVNTTATSIAFPNASLASALAVDHAGNLYVASDTINGAVSKFAPGATTPTALLTGLNYPDALAVDGAGSLFVANFNTNGTVSKFAPGAATPSTTLSGLDQPDALAFDSAGNLYVANFGTGTVSKFALGATSPSATLFGLNEPDALAFDAAGDLYVANRANGTVTKFAPGATTATATLIGLDNPDALAFDSAGNLYVANFGNAALGNETVSKFAPGATTAAVTLTGLSGPDALAFDSAGNLFVANFSSVGVTKFAPGVTKNTQFSPTQTGPDGLAFDSAGNLYLAYQVGFVSKFLPGGGSVTLTCLYSPAAPVFDAAGNLYVSYFTSNGALVSFAPGTTTPSAVYSGVSGPDDLAFDAAGDLYVANYGNENGSSANGNETVTIFAPGATTPSRTITGLSFPEGLAFDAAGNLYVANYGVGAVDEFAPGASTPFAIVSGFNRPSELHFDTAGNLYVADFTASGTISKFAPGATTPSATFPGRGFAFDAVGNLFVENIDGHTISKFAPGATTSSVTLVGLFNPGPTGFDSAGDVYVANEGNGTISKFAPGATIPSTILSGLGQVFGLSLDAAGNLFYVANSTVNELRAPYKINDGNGGYNYTVTTVPSTTGVITKASLVIKAVANTKPWDGTTSAAAIPTVTGLVAGDSISGLTEVYSNPNYGTGKTLSVSAYSVSDGNGGNNYSITTSTNNTGAIIAPVAIFTVPSSINVIEPPQGSTYTVYVPVTVNLPVNATLTYQTVGGTALAGTDFVKVNPGTLHINNASSTQATVQIPITIYGGPYEQPGGAATKLFTVQLLSASTTGSGNAVTQSLLGAPGTATTINLQQVMAPKLGIANQANASAGVFVNITTYWPANPAFTAAQYAQADGDIYLNYSTSLSSKLFGSATIRIPSASLIGSGTFQIPNFRIPINPPAGLLTVTLVAITPNAWLDPSAKTALVGYP